MSTSAERMRVLRARQRALAEAGLVVVPVIVHEETLHATLLEHELITRDQLDNPASVARALERAIATLPLYPVVK